MTQEQVSKKARKLNERVLIGFILIVVSVLLLLRSLGFDFPGFVFSWPMILIVIGVFTGLRDKFRTNNWWILLAIGLFFLFSREFPEFELRRFFWPVIVFAIGLAFLLNWNSPRRTSRLFHTGEKNIIDGEMYNEEDTGNKENKDDLVDAAAVFGSVKKNIYSKSFKGGEVVNVFGGSEINLMHADFTGEVKLEVVNIFGGTTLIVPPHWQIRSEAAAIFGAIEDKRREPAGVQTDKVLVLEGTVIFGGIDIKSA
jgi:predicted membrane protein